MQILPVTSDPSQLFRSSLNGVAYRFRVQWNGRNLMWTLDILDGNTEAPIVLGLPILIGCDILAPFALGIGSLFAVDLAASSAPVLPAPPNGYTGPWPPPGVVVQLISMPQQVDAGEDDLGTRVIVVFFKPGESFA